MNRLKSNVARVKFAREGAVVRRLHTQRIIGEYDVGQHSFGMLSLLMVLHPEAPQPLLLATIAHDLPERFIGDSPRPAFLTGAVDREAYDKASDEILKATGFHVELTEAQRAWLNSIDLCEFYLWTLDQINLGNKNMVKMKNRVEAWFDSPASGEMIGVVADFMREIIDGTRNNPDFWDTCDEICE